MRYEMKYLLCRHVLHVHVLQGKNNSSKFRLNSFIKMLHTLVKIVSIVCIH